MTNPDELVDAHGEEVTLEHVTDAQYDDNDVLDESASTIETETVSMIVSSPSEQDQIRLEGRVGTAELKGTVKSSVDVSTQREGRRDRIQRGGEWYDVIDVADDTHPFVGTPKQTVMLRQLDGR